MVVEGIFVDVCLRAQRGIDQAIGINESKLVQCIEPFHAGLISLQVFCVAQVVLIHEIDGDAHLLNVALQVVFYHLLPAACQFVKIQKADRAYGFLRAPSRISPHPDRSADQNDCHNKAASYGDPCRAVFSESVQSMRLLSLLFCRLCISIT